MKTIVFENRRLMTKQSPVFLQLFIIPDKVNALELLLNTGGNPSNKDSFFPFDKLKTVHFARWIIAPATAKFKASLIYSGNVDGTVDQHLNDLAEILTVGLDQILSHCENYPSEELLNKKSRLEFLRANSKSTPAFYVGAPGRSVQQIEEEVRFHKVIKEFVKKHKSEWKSSKEAHKAIKDFVSSDPQWDHARTNYTVPKMKSVKMILFLLLLVVLLPFIILLVLGIFLFYEWRLKPDGKTINEIPPGPLKALKNQEDIIYQNQLSQVYETKGGLRKLMLHFMLWATNFAAKNWAVGGQLMGTPTIHFARWAFIDGGKRFVFFSNFDGSYDGYLGDFVDNNGWGLNSIYGAAVGYPRTYFVFGGGSYKLLQFMGWGRELQVPTPIWYSAYPWQGLQSIVNRSLLREDLLKGTKLTDDSIKKTLSRI